MGWPLTRGPRVPVHDASGVIAAAYEWQHLAGCRRSRPKLKFTVSTHSGHRGRHSLAPRMSASKGTANIAWDNRDSASHEWPPPRGTSSHFGPKGEVPRVDADAPKLTFIASGALASRVLGQCVNKTDARSYVRSMEGLGRTRSTL